MLITWLGHSCFKVENKDYVVVFDPTEDGYVPGISPIRENANMVICSHEHGDHNARHLIELDESEPCPYIITEIETFHDDKKGELRGDNRITVLDDGELRIAHFGDLGCIPEPFQMEGLMNLDVAMIPVGGFYTIDAETAAKLVQEIKPSVVIPMHYRDDEKGFGFDVISRVDDFVNAMGSAEYKESSSFEILVSEELTEEDDSEINDTNTIDVVVLEPLNIA